MNKREKRNALWKEREINNLCVYCGLTEPVVNKKGCFICLKNKSKKTSDYSKNNRQKINQYKLLVKYQVIEKYGGTCTCCGESQILFLTIDHKNNDGNIERKDSSYSSTAFYLKLRKDEIRSDIQVLCWNCNLGKNVNNGVCPHKEILRKLDPIYDNRRIPQFDMRLKIVWPDDDELIRLCNDKSTSEVAKSLGVDFSAVSGRLKRRNKYHLVNKKSGIKYGEDNKSSKLTKEQVDIIREKNITGTSRRKLASEYNVSISLIDKIVTNKIWQSYEN